MLNVQHSDYENSSAPFGWISLSPEASLDIAFSTAQKLKTFPFRVQASNYVLVSDYRGHTGIFELTGMNINKKAQPKIFISRRCPPVNR